MFTLTWGTDPISRAYVFQIGWNHHLGSQCPQSMSQNQGPPNNKSTRVSYKIKHFQQTFWWQRSFEPQIPYCLQNPTNQLTSWYTFFMVKILTNQRLSNEWIAGCSSTTGVWRGHLFVRTCKFGSSKSTHRYGSPVVWCTIKKIVPQKLEKLQWSV